MLKTMRKNIKVLTPTLWIVIATFVISIFVVWGGAGRLGEGGPSNELATAGKEHITGEVYTQALRTRIESLKTQLKDINRAFIEQLNLPQQVFEQLINQGLLFTIAREMGIRASDEEVANRIKSFPGLQEEGKFIGFEEYKRRLQYNRISLGEFEDSLRKDIILSKTVDVLTAGITVTPEEVWDSYKKSKESAKIEYLALEKSKVELAKKPDVAELQAYFQSHKDKFRIPEKRDAAYVFLKNEDLKKEVELSEADIEKYYRDNPTQFQNPEKVKVGRIYFPFAGKDKAVVQAEAEGVLAKIKAGEDFAALAKIHSKDNKAKDGGDWGLYDWRTLAQKEQDEVNKLQAGKVSELVTLDDGISILKVTEKDAATTTPLSEAKPKIRTILQDQKAREIAADRIAKLEKEAKKTKSIESAAKAPLKVEASGLLKEAQALGDIDPSGSISSAIFKLKVNEISAPIYTYSGVGLAELKKIEPPRPATFDEVKTDVETDVTEAKLMETALARIKEARAKLTDKNWEDIAQRDKLEIKTVDEYKREQYLGTVGENREVDTLAFSLPLKQVSEPVTFANGYCLLRVLDRKEATKADFEKEKETETNNLLEQKRNQFLQSYLAKLRTDEGVKVKYDLFVKLTSDVLSRYESEK